MTVRLLTEQHLEFLTLKEAAQACADPESSVRGCPTLAFFVLFFYLMRGEMIQAGHPRPASETPFKFTVTIHPQDNKSKATSPLSSS